MEFETTVADGVLQARSQSTDWLSTTWNGGFVTAEATYNVTVPEGWERTDLDDYVDQRLRRAGFDTPGPTMLTGVDQAHARGARSGEVTAIATCGLSNPTTLPMDPTDGLSDDASGHREPGTVNIIVGTTRTLNPGGLANLLAVAVEARTATLMAETGFTGTTTDAVVVGCDPTGDPAAFTGSATPVGADTRAAVREALRASLRARYPENEYPASVPDASYGTVTSRTATEFTPER